MTINGDIYTNGSFSLRTTNAYKVNYKFNGVLSLLSQDTEISHAANVAVNEIFDLLYIHVKNQVKNGKKR